jgi:hypothetical protein
VKKEGRQEGRQEGGKGREYRGTVDAPARHCEAWRERPVVTSSGEQFSSQHNLASAWNWPDAHTQRMSALEDYERDAVSLSVPISFIVLVYALECSFSNYSSTGGLLRILCRPRLEGAR